MIHRRQLMLVIWSLVLASQLASTETRQKVTVGRGAETSVRAILNRTEVKLAIRTVAVHPSDALYLHGAADANHVFSMISDLRVSVGEHLVDIPRSVYFGIFDPREISVWFEKGQFVARIDFGDASESYFAVLYFDTKMIRRKLIYSSAIPTSPDEDTRYKMNVLKDQ